MATKFPCPTCGKLFDTLQKVNSHRAAAHSYKAPGKKGPARKPVRSSAVRKLAESSPQVHELRELWTDQNGRILLVDEAGDWWIAKKVT